MTFRIVHDHPRMMDLNVYVDGELAGIAYGYPERMNRDMIRTYPRKIFPPYNQMGLDYCKRVFRYDMRWA